HGWISASSAQVNSTTAASAWVYRAMFENTNLLQDGQMKRQIEDIRESVTEDDYTEAEAIIGWVRGKMANTSEYTHNLKVLFKNDYITDPKRFAIMVSAYAGYARAKGEALVRAK